MKRITSLWLTSLMVAAAFACGFPAAHAQESPVAVIQIKGEIDGSQASLVHKALIDAKNSGARAVLVEIDTFGGQVDAAVAIRDQIAELPMETICYIKNRAWSAGALIAISHKRIAIAPGGSIGAAEPIPNTEKNIAALKAEFAATANKTGRNPRVAEAMVDKTLGLPDYAAPGQILALTDYQAVKVGYADLVVVDRVAVLDHYGLSNAPVTEYTQDWSDKAAGWLTNPAVKAALVSLIFLAILTEIKTAGMGFAAMIGLTAVLLFFGSQWLTGLASWIELVLFASGAILILMELHTPGVGVFGIGGVLCILASFFFALGGDMGALNLLAISLVAAIAVFLLILRRLPSSKLWSRFVLKDSETSSAGFVSSENYEQYLGQTGVTLTLLRPAGVIDVQGVQLDVVSEGKYIQAGTKVTVISITGNRIVVRPVS